MTVNPSISGGTSPVDESAVLQELLGYLNFSNGKPDVRFQSHLNRFPHWLTPGDGGPRLPQLLRERLAELARQPGPFAEAEQATAAIDLVFNRVVPAYRQHHADLLFHLPAADFFQPLFVARVWEATLAQGSPWSETDRIVEGALNQLNDFLGHRPVAVLETRQRMQPYAHERYRPIPLAIRGVGPAAGPYHDLVRQALEILQNSPTDILTSAYFELRQLEELALDVRAYDHAHPVYKRTNYTFGEWDPHCLDSSGRYRRFVVRVIILEALTQWMRESSELSPQDRLYEAGAVLAGTILMASAVSGSDPHTHDSNVSLTSLLPKIARQRDAFYTRLLQSLTGAHAEKLRREAEAVHQPFGRIRQHLNLFLAHFGCRQMQRGSLADIYARMGYPQAAREQAAVIPAASTRFETEIQWRLSVAGLEIERGGLTAAAGYLLEIEDLLHRGIECGALVDPWNILGFQGLYPLFNAREDSVADTRVDKLLSLMEQIFATAGRLWCEASATGCAAIESQVIPYFQRLADFWDRFATTTVADLPAVYGGESFRSAQQASRALAEWYRAGEAAGDVAFWRKHVADFEAPKAYAIVLDILLRKRDLVASMNLLMQWLGHSDEVPLEARPYSICPILYSWMESATSGPNRPALKNGPAKERSSSETLGAMADAKQAAAWAPDLQLIRKFFDFLEVNAGDNWHAPSLESSAEGQLTLRASSGLPTEQIEDALPSPSDAVDHDEPILDEDELFDAAYDNVVYRDSTDDGHAGELLDEGHGHELTELEQLSRQVEQRLRFLVTLVRLWQSAGLALSRHMATSTIDGSSPTATSGSAPAPVMGQSDNAAIINELLLRWFHRCEALQRDLVRMLRPLAELVPHDPAGDPDALSEYDRELHTKFALLNLVVSSIALCHETTRTLRACLPVDAVPREPRAWERRAVEIYRLLLRRDVAGLRAELPHLLRELSRRPLLYVPADKGGRPKDILAARQLQSLIRALLTQLPRLGLHRETWHVLRTAYVMERTAPPEGMSITEFDRLLQAALRSSLEQVLTSAKAWPEADRTDDAIVDKIGQITDMYLRLWLKHSGTMRLSSLEALKEPASWRRIKTFIRTYGSELFHARVLTLGNLRAIIHRGIEWYLEYLQEHADPHVPFPLLDDLGSRISVHDAEENLDLIFHCVVEKFDRFMEYNTTTTQSDYGEQLDCLLDFLRLEASYERHAWNLEPLVLAHQVLARGGWPRVAALWLATLKERTSPLARSHLQRLRKLEKQYAMRLPSVTDCLNERFIKALALDRILACVTPSIEAARENRPSSHFNTLRTEVEKYLQTSSGSALELQPWLQSLADEVQEVAADALTQQELRGSTFEVEPMAVTAQELHDQLEHWEQPLHRVSQSDPGDEIA